MKKIEFAHDLLSESRRSTQLYLESGRDYHKAKAHMYSIFECYAHGLISWNQVRTRWHNSILEYLNLYADRPDLYLSESNRMLGEYESTLQTYKPALDEYKRVNEQKMTSNIVVKGKLNESQAKQQSNLYFNRRALNENQLTDTAGMKTWKQVQESYPNLTAKDELRVRMLTVYEGSTVDTTKLVTTYMSEEPTAMSGPMQTSMRPRPRPATSNVDSASIDAAVQQALGNNTAPTTSPRPMPRPAATQSIGAGSQVTRMPNGSVDGSTRGIDPADAYSPEDLARLTGQPASRLAPTTSPRPMPRPATLKQSANNNIRKEAASIFNKIKLIANEGYKVLPPMDKERYTEIPGLEGPFTTLSGKVVYYDPKEGAYYDRDTDMYLSNDEYTALNNDYSGMRMNRESAIGEDNIPLAHPNYMDTKNNPEILSAFEKQRQNWLKTNPRGGEVDDLNDLVNFGNKVSKVGNPKAAATLTKQSMDYFKNNPGRGLGEAKAKPGHNAKVMARAQDTIRKSIEKSKKDDDDNKEKVDEAGAFSYGKKPRKGTVAYNAAEQRKKQEKDEKPIEPKDQKVGNAKVTKEGEEFKKRQSVAGLKKMIDDHDARAKTTTSPLKKEHHRKMSQQLRDQLADIKEEVELDEAGSYRDSGAQNMMKASRKADKEADKVRAQRDKDEAQKKKEKVSEAVAKIACVKCDEVSTAAAWKKNNGFCPKCKTSSQGVAESVNEATSFKLKVTNPATGNSETQEFNSETALKDYTARAKQRGLKVSRIKPTNEADSAQDLAIQAIQSKLKKAKVSYRDPNAKTAREEDRIAKMLAAKAKKKNESIDEANTSYEKDMDHDKAVVISGVKGVKSTPFRKKFKNMAAYDKWSDSEEASNYEVHDVMNESALTEGDIVDFGMFAGMYADGARTSFMDNEGNFRQITATGGLPREYTLDGKPVSREDLMRITKRARLGRFEPGMSESTDEAGTVNEISPATKDSYIRKADDDYSKAHRRYAHAVYRDGGKHYFDPDTPEMEKDAKRIKKRERGLAMATKDFEESNAVSEAVTLDYSRYMRSHGKKPRDSGGGSSTWMFTTAEFGEPGEDEVFRFQGNFADAKKAAAKWAKSQGQYRVYAMEGTTPAVNEQQTITEAQFDEAAGEKDACYHKVKSRYKVWPSAYASGALSKCRKVGADNWGKSKE